MSSGAVSGLSREDQAELTEGNRNVSDIPSAVTAAWKAGEKEAYASAKRIAAAAATVPNGS